MKKTVSKLLALAMAASLVLSGCGGSGNSGNSEETTGASGSEESTSASSENEIMQLWQQACYTEQQCVVQYVVVQQH